MAEISGTATYEDGTALSGATVTAEDQEAGEVVGTTTTNADGTYTITDVPGTTAQVLIEYEENGTVYRDYAKPYVTVETVEPTFWSDALHRYNHDEGSGSTLTDTGAAGTLSDGTITGSVWDSSISQYQGASLDHDGTDDYVTATNQDTMDGFTTGMTVVCWLRPRDTSARQSFATVGSSWIIRVDSGQWHVYIWDDSTGDYTRWAYDTYPPATDTWFRVGFRWSSGNHTELIADGTTYTHDATGGAGVAVDTVATSTSDLEMPGTSNQYNGYMDGPLMIWDYALTDQEVQDDYDAFA